MAAFLNVLEYLPGLKHLRGMTRWETIWLVTVSMTTNRMKANSEYITCKVNILIFSGSCFYVPLLIKCYYVDHVFYRAFSTKQFWMLYRPIHSNKVPNNYKKKMLYMYMYFNCGKKTENRKENVFNIEMGSCPNRFNIFINLLLESCFDIMMAFCIKISK